MGRNVEGLRVEEGSKVGLPHGLGENGGPPILFGNGFNLKPQESMEITTRMLRYLS